MVLTIVITVFFTIIFTIEMYHDDSLRQIRNQNRALAILLGRADPTYNPEQDISLGTQLSDKWHKLDWIGWFFIAALVTTLDYFISKSFISISTLFLIGSLRVTIITIINNLRLGSEWYYLGLGTFAKIFEGKERLICGLTILTLIASILIRVL